MTGPDRAELGRRLVERGGHFDPDEVAGQLSAFAWAGLRGIHQPMTTA